jgi:quercetin dioxygenase-like cupin family protein
MGMCRMSGLPLLVLLAGVSAAQQQPVPVDQEPHHKVVLRNDFVEVMHVTLPAGERTLYHTHSHDRAAVELSTSPISQQRVGEAEGPVGPTQPGDLSVATLAGGGYSHRVHNAGSGVFEVLDVEFLHRPEKPSEVAAATVAGENPSARAYRWHLAPGEKTPEHTHHRPYLIVAATSMQLKMTAPDRQSSTHDVKAGDFHWVDAQVTHVLSNDGPTAGEIVEFELK